MGTKTFSDFINATDIFRWCDIKCKSLEECNYDGSDCDECADNCGDAYFLFEFVSNAFVKDNKISVDEFCASWSFVKDDPVNENLLNNCSEIIQYDNNNDTLISFREAIIGLNEWFDVNQEKADQIDCQNCMPNPDDYV